MKKKNGFTLIELLAVIIILGILMIIAIPSVTRYISDSRKNAYVDTAKEVIGSARNLVNSGNLGMYSTNTTYYIPVECIKTENALKSPYGDFIEGGAYVGVIYDGKGYNYYWISVDDAGQGVRNITRLDKLDTDDIESDLKKSDITDVIEKTGIGNRIEINILDCSNNTWDPIILSNTNNNVPEEGGKNESTGRIAYEVINEVEGLEDIADAKRYNGPSPNNYATIDGESWRIIGVYGNNLKIIKTVKLPENKKYHNTIINGYLSWASSDLSQYLNNDYYNSLSTKMKNMIENSTWYVKSSPYYYKAEYAYNSVKNEEWTGNIGLIAPYEVLYSANKSCWNTSADGLTEACLSSIWLKKGEDYFTLIPYNTENDSILIVNSQGGIRRISFNKYSPIDEMAVYPVVYLKSSVKITGGTGTVDDPYTLDM